MGIARRLVQGLFGFLFTSSLVILILLISTNQMTEYSTLKPLMTGLVTQQLTENVSQMNQYYSYIKFKCKTQDSVEIPLGTQNITLNCSELETVDQEKFIPFISEKLFNETYYKKYNCEVIDCIRQDQQGLLILASQHGNNFLKSTLNLLLIATIIFAVIFIFSIETWPKRVKSFGGSLIFTAVPFFVLYLLKDLLMPFDILDTMPQQSLEVFNGIVNQFFTSMIKNFLIVLVAGVILIILGYVLVFRENKKKK
jgi:hypothetical protein